MWICVHSCINIKINFIAVPTAPRNLHFANPSSGITSSVTLVWSRPDPPNGLITQYNFSDITNSYYLNKLYYHRYLILVQTHKVKLFMIPLFYKWRRSRKLPTVLWAQNIHCLVKNS